MLFIGGWTHAHTLSSFEMRSLKYLGYYERIPKYLFNRKKNFVQKCPHFKTRKFLGYTTSSVNLTLFISEYD